MSLTSGQKRSADSVLPADAPAAKISTVSPDNNNSPSPPVLQEESALRYDLLEMENMPRYWKQVYNLGTGSFGQVHLVHSDRLDPTGRKFLHNEFVVKLIKLPADKLASVVREVELHRACRSHRNVLFIGLCYCQVLEDGYRVQMCLEYAALSDLSFFALRPKTERHVAYACDGLLQALEHVHSRGIVHGDVSIKNVLLTHRGVIKLADFGYAETVENAKRKDQKHTKICGTPGFIAPEIINQKGYDTRADIWSVATFACYIMSGRSPFQQGMLFDLQLYQRLISEYFEPIIPDEFSDLFQDFIDLMYSYDPDERLSATNLLEHDFLREKVSQQEMTNHYKELRSSHGLDLPYPDESAAPFFVPVTKE